MDILEEQQQTEPLANGRDGGTDEKLVSGNLEVYNSIQDKSGTFTKRPGVATNAVTVTNTRSSLFSRNGRSDQPLVLSGLFDVNDERQRAEIWRQSSDGTYDESTELLNGVMRSINFERVFSRVIGSNTDPVGDSVLDSEGNLFISVDSGITTFNLVTKTISSVALMNEDSASSTDESRLVLLDDLVFSFIALSSGAYIAAEHVANDDVAQSINASDVVTDKSSTAAAWDVCSVTGAADNYIVLVYIDSAGADLQAKIFTQSGGNLSSATDVEVTDTEVDTNSIRTVHCFPQGTDTCVIVWVDNASNDIYGAILNTSTGAITTSATALVTLTNLPRSVSGAISGTSYGPASEGHFHLWYEDPTAETFNLVQVKNDLSASTSPESFSGKGIYTKAVGYDNGTLLVSRHTDSDKLTVHDSAFDGVPVVNGYAGTAATMSTHPSLTRDANTGLIYFAEIVDSKLSVYSVDPTFRTVQSLEFDNTQIVNSGLLKVSDLDLFDVSYEPPIISVAAGTTGSIANGTYLYTAIFEWVDSQGRIYRSAPALPQSITLTGSNDSVMVTCNGLDSLSVRTERQNGLGISLVRIAIYRTLDDGTLYYRVGVQSSLVGSFTDTLADASIEDNAQLYTNGDLLENSVPPGFRCIVPVSDRLAGVSAEDNSIWFSKPPTPGIGLEFSAFLTTTIPGAGKFLAAAPLDGNAILFTNSSIYVLGGEFPNNAGFGSLPESAVVSRDIGVKNSWRDVISTPAGILFKSQKGWYFLDRSRQLTYVGSPVEDMNAYTVLDTCSDSNNHRCYILLDKSAPQLLVFDYESQEWSFWDGFADKTLTCITSPYVLSTTLDPQASLWVGASDGSMGNTQLTDVYQDFGSDYTFRLKTQWYKPSGIVGFQRLWEILVLGEYLAASTLTIKIYYDYDDSTAAETFTKTLTSDPNPFLFRVVPAKQQCTAFRLDLEDSSPTAGVCFSLTAIRYLIGVNAKTPVPEARNL